MPELGKQSLLINYYHLVTKEILTLLTEEVTLVVAE